MLKKSFLLLTLLVQTPILNQSAFAYRAVHQPGSFLQPNTSPMISGTPNPAPTATPTSTPTSTPVPSPSPSSSGSTSASSNGLLYNGGPVLSNVQVYSVLWGPKVNPAIVSALPDFYSSIVSSDYIDWLKIYNTNINDINGKMGTQQSIGRGSFIQSISLTPSISGKLITDDQIRAELQKQIANKNLPAPTANSIYMIHFPKGITISLQGSKSCQAFCAYHNSLPAAGGGNIVYGVIPDQDGTCAMGCGTSAGPGTTLERVTLSASHELTEAITDPIPEMNGSWQTANGQEIGDLCQDAATLKGKANAYQVQQEWDNSANACTIAPTYTSN